MQGSLLGAVPAHGRRGSRGGNWPGVAGRWNAGGVLQTLVDFFHGRPVVWLIIQAVLNQVDDLLRAFFWDPSPANILRSSAECLQDYNHTVNLLKQHRAGGMYY